MNATAIMSFWDWVALSVFLLCYLGYPRVYALLHTRARRPLRADIFLQLRETLAQSSTTAEGRTLIAGTFQTWTRMLVFMGGTTFLALGGAMGLLLNSERTMALSSFSFLTRLDHVGDVRFRLILFVVLAGWTFLQFVWGLKALYNLSLAVHQHDAETCFHYLSHMDLDLSSGMRSLYYLSVLFLWFFGAEFLMLGAVILTLMIARYDFMWTRY